MTPLRPLVGCIQQPEVKQLPLRNPKKGEQLLLQQMLQQQQQQQQQQRSSSSLAAAAVASADANSKQFLL